MFNIDVTILYLVGGMSIFLWVLGLFIGRADQSAIGIILCLIGGLMWISVWALSDNVAVGYNMPQIANTTETGGNTTCTTTISTSCSVASILKSFSYKNTTGQYTNSPDALPNYYPLVGNSNTGANSQNFYIKIYMIGIGIVLVFIGAFQFNLGNGKASMRYGG